ncbi:MAG: GNAT family N-acetyltransferase [Alphaproteobacteria bacterium]|nr:GNAT family N-acetyltransferase [Alphaproteobacteria bacterium]
MPCRGAEKTSRIGNNAGLFLGAASAGGCSALCAPPRSLSWPEPPGVITSPAAGGASVPLEPAAALRPAAAAANRVVDIASGPLQVRLADCAADIDAAQALRYRIFYEKLGARPLPGMEQQRRDSDAFDQICDHLLVLDHSRGAGIDAVVGTYRLIRRDAAARLGAFYSAGEYDIARLIAYPGEILELGRSCVDAGYRARPVMQLLWSGIAAYVFHYDIALMFGCASLPGIDPDALAVPLSYLYHHHLAPPALRARALPERYVDMRRRDPALIDPARTLAGLPPLIKGYLRLGGFVGDGAVVDEQFNTIDVCIVVKTDLVTEKYSRHYERQSKETWAA